MSVEGQAVYFFLYLCGIGVILLKSGLLITIETKHIYYMAGKIKIDSERCKGCGLCIKVCPQNCIKLSRLSNRLGYFFAEPLNSCCNGCALCALVCPDVAIEVFRESGKTVSAKGRAGPSLVKDKP